MDKIASATQYTITPMPELDDEDVELEDEDELELFISTLG